VICRRTVGRAYPRPDPPPLMTARTKNARPFEVTVVDFTGALHVNNTGGNKAYICLFTCGVTIAIHLEVVPDLLVETFLQALRRFTACRSLPRLIISDNTSTYEAVAKELEQLINSDNLGESLCTLGVQWKLIPKRAPWYAWVLGETHRLDQNYLAEGVGKILCHPQELQTLVVEIEAVLNDRPLTYVSPDLDDQEPLTPSHLLCGQRITSLPHKIVDDDPMYNVLPVREIAPRQRKLLQHFEKRWKREYLTSLHKLLGTTSRISRLGM